MLEIVQALVNDKYIFFKYNKTLGVKYASRERANGHNGPIKSQHMCLSYVAISSCR